VKCTRCLREVETGARWCSFCGEPVKPVSGLTEPLPDTTWQFEPADNPVAGEPIADRPIAAPPSPEPPMTFEPVYEPLPVQAPPASGMSIAALVFSIAGLVGPLPLLGSVLALIFGRRALREAARGNVGGFEIARAARIIAWTSIVLYVIAAAVVGVFIGLAVHEGRTLFGG